MYEYFNLKNLILGIPFTFFTYVGITMFKEYYLQIKKNLKKNLNKKSQ